MPLPKIEYHAEEVTVESVEYGRDDHGILTCTLFCEWSGGSRQGFGNLCLDEVTGPAFVRDLCAFFGADARPGEEYWSLTVLTGRRVRALWYQRGGAMDGLELDGRRFMLWEWRRRTFPDAEVLDPRADQIASLRREIASRERQLAELRDEMREAVDAAFDWPAVRKAVDAVVALAPGRFLPAPQLQVETVGHDRNKAVWTAIFLAHNAVHGKDVLEAQNQAAKLRKLVDGIEALRGPLERLCAELGVHG